MGDVDGGSTSHLEGHGVHTSIGLMLGMQRSPYWEGMLLQRGKMYDRTNPSFNTTAANADATPITALGEQANPASC